MVVHVIDLPYMCDGDYPQIGTEIEVRLAKWHKGKIIRIDSEDDQVPLEVITDRLGGYLGLWVAAKHWRLL